MEGRKWGLHLTRRVVPPRGVLSLITFPAPAHTKTYEVIGNPPNVSVPTHFAKVVLTSRPSSPSTPQVPEISTGAFVLPNAAISDETSLESFVVPSMSKFYRWACEHVSDTRNPRPLS
jgi:DNA/RNA endonuclease G (NUC1)